MPDHNTPTHDQDKPIEDPVSKAQVDALERNAKEFGLTYYGMMSPDNGIIHVVGPEKGLSLPGMTVVCGDSHTSTHGAMGAVAFGIGTSEVEMVLASQCILQKKPKTMSIRIEGELGKGVTAKDLALYLMSKLTTSGATGYFVEYRGSTVRALSMEGRLTLSNLSIEMGARGGFIAPDETTFAYLKGREFAPKGEEWIDLVYPQWDGVVYLTYKRLRNAADLRGQIDTSSRMLEKHYQLASGVEEQFYEDAGNRVYGTVYHLKGNKVATTCQFWATDSVHHYLRGALFLNHTPNNDSLAPVLNYIQEDIEHLMETLRWR